jgi:alpha-glucosidase
VHDAIAGMRRVIDAYSDRALIGEAYLPIDRLMAYYGAGGLGGVHLPFNFHLIGATWNARALAALIAEYEAALPAGAWPNWVLGNHDRSRLASRLGAEAAPLAAMLLLTLRGTPTLYYGDEIGMTDVPIPPERAQDPWGKNVPGFGLGRDPARTPMPWDGGPQGGFTTGDTPWLPLGAGAATRNVATEACDPASLLSLYRRLLALRRAEPALSLGDIALVETGEEEDEGVLAYARRFLAAPPSSFLVALNLAAEPRRLALPERRGGATLVVTTRGDRDGTAVSDDGRVELRPGEGVILRLDGGTS